MKPQLNDRVLLLQLNILDAVRRGMSAMRRRLAHSLRDQAGQTPTEYLMIVGLMAAAIVTIFVTFFWGTVKGAASSWADKVSEAVGGSAMQ